uniref:Putative secreted protein n=1 Tax=Anopheles marajoara TaxID=58244 RepID=A0A2M4CBB0_9DIPT
MFSGLFLALLTLIIFVQEHAQRHIVVPGTEATRLVSRVSCLFWVVFCAEGIVLELPAPKVLELLSSSDDHHHVAVALWPFIFFA